jgi:transcriptional repressor NrdR
VEEELLACDNHQIVCPQCGGDSRVIDSRPRYGRTQRRRRRECLVCQHRFSTVERTVGAVTRREAEIARLRSRLELLSGIGEQ